MESSSENKTYTKYKERMAALSEIHMHLKSTKSYLSNQSVELDEHMERVRDTEDVVKNLQSDLEVEYLRCLGKDE